MKAYTYVSEGKFELTEKQKPVLMHERDAIVKITLQAFVQATCILNMVVFLALF